MIMNNKINFRFCMRCTSHLLVIWEAKSRILFSKYTQTKPPCKVSDIFRGMQYGVHRILTSRSIGFGIFCGG